LNLIAPPMTLDDCLGTFLGVVALDVAIQSGLIAALASDAPATAPLLPETSPLVVILRSNGVLKPEVLSLTERFASLWQEQSVHLRTRVGFLRRAAADVALYAEDLFYNTDSFMEKSSTFQFFDYEPATRGDAEARSHTQRWVDYVAALTDAEAPSLLDAVSLPDKGLVLEIGGNAGAFARHLLARHTGLSYAILDLSGVCALGRADPANTPFGDRLRFLPGDMRKMNWRLEAGGAPDVIIFKSVLHDWPAEEAADLLARASRYLAPSGRIIILERGAYTSANLMDIPFSSCANLVFSPFYRAPDVYIEALRVAWPSARMTIRPVVLDMGWFVTMATERIL
jgi:SAM-dependent methyltransferase